MAPKTNVWGMAPKAKAMKAKGPKPKRAAGAATATHNEGDIDAEKDSAPSKKTTVARKRPAASWHAAAADDASEPESSMALHADAGDDVDDGKQDFRPTTRGQRYVFEKLIDRIDPIVLARYEYLKDPRNKVLGKERECRAIINAHVSRNATYKTDALSVKSRTVEQIFEKKDVSSDMTAQAGMGKFETVGTKLNGNWDLFAQAQATGEVWEGADGLYYTKQRTLQVGKKWTESVKVKQRYDIATESGMLSVLADLSSDHADVLDEFEAKVGTSGLSSSGSKKLTNEGCHNTTATKDDIRWLQEAYDATTRLTLASQRVYQELGSKAKTDTVKEMVAKAIELCKALVDSSEKAERKHQ